MQSPFVIRCARPDERVALEELQRRASLAWEEYREALLAHPGAIDLPLEQIEAGRTYVAERFGEKLGFSVVFKRSDGNAELDGLFVEPAHWRQGVGALLVREAARFATAEGAQSLCVIANPMALRFYEACGFQMEGELQTQFGKGVLMRKPLRTAGTRWLPSPIPLHQLSRPFRLAHFAAR